MKMKKNKKVIGAIVILVSITILIILTFTDRKDYITVDELIKSKEEYVGKKVNVRGSVKEGSMEVLENGSYKFVLCGENNEVVIISESLPSNFGEGKDVIVYGMFTEKYVIISDKIMVGCPSKYG